MNRFALYICIFVLVLCVSSYGATDYVVQDICPFDNVYSYAVDINNRGQVIGNCGSQAFIWSYATGLRFIGNLGGGSASAASINDRGEIVGSSTIALGVSHAFYWSEETGMIDIGLEMFGSGESRACEINNQGQILLYPPTTDWWRPVLWDPSGALIRVDSPLTMGHVSAHDMNNYGQVVGFYNAYPHNPPFMWDPINLIHNLPELPHSNPEPFAINDAGYTVGHVRGNYGTDPCLWDPVKGLQILGSLPGYRENTAYGINDNLQIVGEFAKGCICNAFLWTSQNGYQLLPSNRQPAYCTAWDINNAGQIVGSDVFESVSDYLTHAAVWFPVTQVQIDIKPDSSINPINPESKGIVPVVLFSSPDFSISDIDTASIRLAGAAPVKMNCRDVDLDGNSDLFIQFRTTDLKLKSDSAKIELTAFTNVGNPVKGEDTITIVPQALIR